VQIRFSLIVGGRPLCVVDPKHKINRHGHYLRHCGCDTSEPLERILRHLCTTCLRTISVLPDHMLPYRAISVPKVEANFDAKARGDPPPPATEKESGCLKRAWEHFTRRMTALAVVLGQMVQLVVHKPKLIWLQLRRWGNLPDILRLLNRSFNTSLLHDYLCLLPWNREPD
jgi:hypothetical protein